jgi:hypothetical protein
MEFLLAQIPQRYLETTAAGGFHHNCCRNHPQNPAIPGKQEGLANVLQMIEEPTNPVSVEIQFNWREEVLYPPSVCTLEVNVPV